MGDGLTTTPRTAVERRGLFWVSFWLPSSVCGIGVLHSRLLCYLLVLCQMISWSHVTPVVSHTAKGRNPGPSALLWNIQTAHVFSLRRSGSRGWNGKANDISRGYNRSFTFIRPFMEVTTPFITFVTIVETPILYATLNPKIQSCWGYPAFLDGIDSNGGFPLAIRNLPQNPSHWISALQLRPFWGMLKPS